MDSAMIELSSNVDLVSGQMDDAVGTPMLMKISPDMLPVMVASVDMDGMDVKEISALADETVMPAFERIDGERRCHRPCGAAGDRNARPGEDRRAER